MNKEQKKFKQVIKKRRKREKLLKTQRTQKLWNKKSPQEKGRILFERRHAKDIEKKRKEAMSKLLKDKGTTITTTLQ